MISDLGFMWRQNAVHTDGQLTYRTTEPWGRTLETRTQLEVFDRTTLDGLNLAILRPSTFRQHHQLWPD